MSIARMIASLEQKNVDCDVLILDRGVFDAFCWFDWLYKNQAISNVNKTAIENFLSMDLLVNRIDIVFAFTATPDVSIEREYVNLLTDKPGTIMSKKILDEYLTSVRHIIRCKKKYFHKIFEIDTSEKEPDSVGKEVTEMTLKALREMLMENIGYLTSLSKSIEFLTEKRFLPMQNDDFSIDSQKINFGLRNDVENDSNLIQPIPIAVITDSNRKQVLTVKKRKEAVTDDSPEKDKILLYVGGHTRAEDFTEAHAKDLLSICRYTLHREVKEELGISLSFDEIEPHLIYTPDSPKSKKHLAVCFLVEKNDIEDLRLRIDEEELILNRGSSKSGTFQDIAELVKKEGDHFEPWSIEIANNLFKQRIPSQLSLTSDQISLFDD